MAKGQGQRCPFPFALVITPIPLPVDHPKLIHWAIFVLSIMLHIQIEHFADHFLILGMMFLGLVLEKVDTGLA